MQATCLPSKANSLSWSQALLNCLQERLKEAMSLSVIPGANSFHYVVRHTEASFDVDNFQQIEDNNVLVQMKLLPLVDDIH